MLGRLGQSWRAVHRPCVEPRRWLWTALSYPSLATREGPTPRRQTQPQGSEGHEGGRTNSHPPHRLGQWSGGTVLRSSRFGGGSSAAAAQSVVMVYSHSCGPRLLNVCSLTGRNSRGCVRDGDDVAVAVQVSLSNLRPWMPWATEAAADPVAQRARGREAELHWDQGSDYSCAAPFHGK